MVIASKFILIAFIIISFVLALIGFYFFSDFSKQNKKKYLDEVVSQLVNFILFIWVGKILLNLSLFLRDPLAVLAYPSDSNAFYLAFLLTAFFMAYRWKKKNLDFLLFAEAFTYIFLLATFFYEFIEFIFNEHLFSLGYLIVFMVLLLIYYFMKGKVSLQTLLILIVSGLSIGLLILSFVYPYVALFGYLIERWFILLFFVGSVAILFYTMKGKI